MKHLKILLILVLTFSVAFSATALTPAEKRAELEKKLENADAEYATAKEKKLALDEQISALQGDIDEVTSMIYTLDTEIAEQNAKIDELNNQLNVKKGNFYTRLRALQYRGSTSYLDVILGADSFSDFLLRLTLVTNIIDHDREMMNEISALKSEVEDSKAIIVAKKAELVASRDLLSSQKAHLDSLAAEQASVMAELSSDINEYKEAIRQQEEETKKAASAMSGNYDVVRKGTGELQWPVPAGGYISSPFGYRTETAINNHTGMDIAIATGNAIVAADTGTVSRVIYGNYGYGNYLIVNHGNGMSTLYAHCSKIYVKVGQSVSRGETIAAIGSTGYSTGPHLHFEVIVNGVKVNPYPYVS